MCVHKVQQDSLLLGRGHFEWVIFTIQFPTPWEGALNYLGSVWSYHICLSSGRYSAIDKGDANQGVVSKESAQNTLSSIQGSWSLFKPLQIFSYHPRRLYCGIVVALFRTYLQARSVSVEHGTGFDTVLPRGSFSVNYSTLESVLTYNNDMNRGRRAQCTCHALVYFTSQFDGNG